MANKKRKRPANKPLPVADASVAARVDGRPDDKLTLARSILIVDNDPQRRDALLTLLRLEGITCHCVDSARHALDMVDGSQPTNLLVKSLLVPQKIAFEAQLREKAPKLQVGYYDELGSVLLPACKRSDSSLGEFYFSVIDFLFSIVDAESGKLRAHVYTVAKYCRIIMQQLELEGADRDAILIAAYLHDFDKFFPTHKMPKKMSGLLRSLKMPSSVEAILKHVNERFNGQGKPKGLEGSAIPLGSRIVAVANMLDEISRGKADTQVIRKNEAFQSLRKRAGSYVDPNLVDLLIEGLKSEYSHLYKDIDARVLLLAKQEDLRFRISKLLMERGFTTRTVESEQQIFETIREFAPHLIISSIDGFCRLVDACREAEVFIRQSVLVIGRQKDADQIPNNDYVACEGLLSIPIKAKGMISHIEKVLDRVVRQEEKARETAAFFEKAGSLAKAGNVYAEIGDYRKAAALYERAETYSLAGEMYENLEEFRRAAQAFENGGDYENAARCYGKVGLFEDRARVFEKTGDYYYSAKNKLFARELDEALELFQRLQPGHEKYRKACYYMAKIYMEKREWQRAIPLYKKVIGENRVNQKNLRHHYNMAVAYEHVGNLSLAVEIYEKILGVEYNFRDVFRRVEYLREKLKLVEDQTKIERKVADFMTVNATHEQQKTRYEKKRVAGRGGMGVVYEAVDLVLGRRVALKVLSAAFREDAFVIETFLREAKAAAMLNHVNIVTIYDAGIENGNYFIAMEMIEGKTLKEIIQTRQFSIPSVLKIMRQVANGLRYAHSKKIIHRDLTNGNIMITKDNIVKIMDFGLARIVEQLMTEQSIIGGTPSYMAPEQVQGAPIDQRADVYALGVDLFELMTGRLPFIDGDLGYQHVHIDPPNPKEINPKIPEELAEVILKCLRKNPDERFQSVEELMEVLKL